MWYSTVGCIVMLILSLLMAPHAADAQQRGKVPRIGFLGDGSAASRAVQTLEPLREGLRELGYVEGQNVILEVRWTDGHSERLPELAGETLAVTVRPPDLEDDVLPFNISKLAQALAQGFQGLYRTRGGRSIAQEADPGHLPPLLRVSGVRRHEQAQDEHDDTPDGAVPHDRLLKSASCRLSS